MKTLREYINIIEAAESSCPLATKDIELNTKNRDFTQDKYNYGPLNIDEPGDYWEGVADEWDTTVEAAKKSLCGNCVAFDISPRMEDCMPGSVSDDEDGGRLGYCWMHHFKCHSLRTCHTWAKGGPIDEDEVSREWGERNQQDEPVKEVAKADLKYSIYREIKPGAMHDTGIPMGVEPLKLLFMTGIPGKHVDTIMQKLQTKLPDQNFVADLEIEEDIAKMSMGDTIKDFYKSDAPQFKGKSKRKRRQMAIAAKLSADEK